MGYYDFESDEERALVHIPMAMRYRLDQSGIRLTLRQWQALPMTLRHRVLDLPCKTSAEIDAFQHELTAFVKALIDEDVARFKVSQLLPWQAQNTPDELNRALSESGCERISNATWGRLNDFQRYVLVAFARPGRVSRRLPFASQEFCGALATSLAAVRGTATLGARGQAII